MHRPAKDAVLKDAVRAELFVSLDVVRGKHVRLLFFVDLVPEGGEDGSTDSKVFVLGMLFERFATLNYSNKYFSKVSLAFGAVLKDAVRCLFFGDLVHEGGENGGADFFAAIRSGPVPGA